jgi:hypothetical protein
MCSDSIVCANCQRTVAKKYARRGLCGACDQYKRNHGVDRPPLFDKVKCQNQHCGNQVTLYNTLCYSGLCRRCYEYRRKRGADWTPQKSQRRPGEPMPLCEACRSRPAPHTKPFHMCNRCYEYWRRNKKRRPTWMDAEHCRNCKRPRIALTGAFVDGRCRECRKHRAMYKKERPAELWGSGVHGWCDCGQPAQHSITVQIYRHTDTLSLCNDCYAEEMRQQSWYGVTQHDRKGTGSDSGTQSRYSYSGDD